MTKIIFQNHLNYIQTFYFHTLSLTSDSSQRAEQLKFSSIIPFKPQNNATYFPWTTLRVQTDPYRRTLSPLEHAITPVKKTFQALSDLGAAIIIAVQRSIWFVKLPSCLITASRHVPTNYPRSSSDTSNNRGARYYGIERGLQQDVQSPDFFPLLDNRLQRGSRRRLTFPI